MKFANLFVLLFCKTSAINELLLNYCQLQEPNFTKKNFHREFPRCFSTFFETLSLVENTSATSKDMKMEQFLPGLSDYLIRFSSML